MRLKGLATTLVASAALLVAGAALSQDSLVDGSWSGTDEKNTNITGSTQVLFGTVSDASVDALCVATTGEVARLHIDANERPDKTAVTSSKATIAKMQKAEPADASVTLPGGCDGPGVDAGDQCFDNGDCLGDCADPPPMPIDLTCDRARIGNTVREKAGKPTTMKFKADAKNCDTGSAQAASALTTACANQKGIRLKTKDAEITKMQISGHSAAVPTTSIVGTSVTADEASTATAFPSEQPGRFKQADVGTGGNPPQAGEAGLLFFELPDLSAQPEIASAELIVELTDARDNGIMGEVPGSFNVDLYFLGIRTDLAVLVDDYGDGAMLPTGATLVQDNWWVANDDSQIGTSKAISVSSEIESVYTNGLPGGSYAVFGLYGDIDFTVNEYTTFFFEVKGPKPDLEITSGMAE
jgi:hypothetical protein